MRLDLIQVKSGARRYAPLSYLWVIECRVYTLVKYHHPGAHLSYFPGLVHSVSVIVLQNHYAITAVIA